MDGILNVLKPPGMTSFDVVAYLRRLLCIKKIGHAGTLDPTAAGVLPVCTGKATKAIEFLMDKDKCYRAELTLGIVTDTQDSSGKILSYSDVKCSDGDIEKAVKSFSGTYMQTPPMYSALRVGGKRLYELAREGTEIERKKREVRIYSINVLNIDRSNGVKVLFDVSCSKGTYIRTLCADIGERLGCGGHMSFLLRRKAGPFDISASHTLEEIEKGKVNGTLSGIFLGIDSVFDGLAGLMLEKSDEKKFMNGMRIPVPDSVPEDAEMVRVYDSAGRFAAIGAVIKGPGNKRYLKSRKFF